MKVKFGFYIALLNGIGVYNPVKEFYEAKIVEWLEVRDGVFAKGNPTGTQIMPGEPIALIATLKAT